MAIRILLHKMKRTGSVIALGILLACYPCAFALNPSLDVSQYAHTVWKVGEGFSKGLIRALAQTPDGYLWLGTEFGLLRFDGVRTMPWQPLAGEQLPNTDIRSLQAARDGRLWIGTFSGLASWKDGKLTHYPELDGQVIEALLEDREGAIWVAGWSPSVGRLCRIQSGNIECYGEDGRLGSGVTSLYEDSRGNIWAGAANGLWRWKPGPPKLYPMPDPAERIYALIESDDGGILIAKHSGITKLKDAKAEAYRLPVVLPFQPHRLLRDRQGGLWIGALVDRGLLHIHEGRTDLFTRADGLSGGSVSSLLEDREGNIWVATVDGLDRFRDFAIPMFSDQQGLSSQVAGSILAAKDGSLWIGTSEGLNRWNKGQITVYRKPSVGGAQARSPASGLTAETRPHSKSTVREITDDGLPANRAQSLFEDDRGQIWVGTQSGVAFFKSDRFVPVTAVPYGVVYSFANGGAGNVWMSHQEGLFHLFRERVVERLPWAKLGRSEPATFLVHDAVQGGLWLGFRDGGVAYFKDGQLRAAYSSTEGLAEGMVRDLYIDGHGTLWASADGGLSRIKDGRVLTLTSQNGLPCDTVHWMREDDAQSVWLYMTCGLLRIARSELDAWASHSKQTIQATVFDSSDGVKTHRYTGGYGAVVAKSADGRLWFLPIGGVSVIDPHHLPTNELPPPVHIEQITADGQTYDVSNGLRLPPLVRDLEIDFTALSFVEPDHVRFRVKLEGQDEGWRELVNQRQVHYTNLSPNHYRFRVQACNNSGVWNEEGALLDFSIAPAFYQTIWFRMLVVAVLLALLAALYRFRIYQLRSQERKLRDVVETIPTFAWTARPDGSVDFVNRHWQDYTGLSSEQTAGSRWQAAVHPEDLERYVERWRVSLATGEPFGSEVRFRRAADGQYRWFLSRAVPLRNRNGKIVKWYGVATDIEERERARQLEAELQHTNRLSMLGELTASLAHEINQPITSSLLNAGACRRLLKHDEPDLEEVREAVQSIEQAGKRAAEIISHVKSFYKKNAPRQRERVEVNEVVGEMLMLLHSEADRRTVAMRTELDTQMPAVRADRVQLQQVMMNLMLNGIEAMGKSGGELTVRTQGEAGQVRVTVSDTGVGLPAAKPEEIFTPFYTTKAEGTGMGLAISRSIIEAHGGKLWAANHEGRGASFHFTLPADDGDRH